MKLDVMSAIFNLGGGEIILILAGALILFGGKKLPELASGLGHRSRTRHAKALPHQGLLLVPDIFAFPTIS
jgi:hypothetical protein